MFEKFKKDIQSFIQECVNVDDTPHRIAFAFSLGVFIGILPFAGVIAAIAIAMYFKLNKPAIVLGSVITNTWLGFIVLAISIQWACYILKVDFNLVKIKIEGLFKNFHWEALNDPYFTQIMGAVVLWYLILSLVLSFLSYFVCLAVIYFKKSR
jgi:uncharacterized protein (DUF2062 family)